MLNRLEYPVVLDADAFFGIENWEFLDHRFILTPHPGEFAAMTGYRRPVSNKEQIEQVLSFTRKTKAVLVLKGAPTIVAQGGEVVYINSTGNSGMATAGSGDVLAGLIGSLLAQGIAPKNAALLGVWLHGKAGDLALSNESKESLTANSIIQNLGSAFLSLT